MLKICPFHYMYSLQPDKTLLAGVELGSSVVMPTTTLDRLKNGKLLDEWRLARWMGL